MTDIICTYTGNRDETLVAYLYDDIDEHERATFDAHLRTCARCRTDLKALGGVREQLARWDPPEPNFTFSHQQSIRHPQSAVRNDVRWWQQIPAWAQVAAAVLVLGASIGLANFDIRYDASGLSVRTGWMAPAKTAADTAAPAAASAGVTRDELIAFEQRLQTELRDQQTSSPTAVSARSEDVEVMRRVKAIVDESEKREKRELALRIAEAFGDFEAQRRTDLANVGVVQNKTGTEILRQRQQLDQMNYMLQRAVSLRVPQQ
jgi:anti-sigma factor RsiW